MLNRHLNMVKLGRHPKHSVDLVDIEVNILQSMISNPLSRMNFVLASNFMSMVGTSRGPLHDCA